MNFSIKDFFSKYGQILSFQFPADLVTFTEETPIGKLLVQWGGDPLLDINSLLCVLVIAVLGVTIYCYLFVM